MDAVWTRATLASCERGMQMEEYVQTYFRRRWCFGGQGRGHWGSSFEIGGRWSEPPHWVDRRAQPGRWLAQS